MHHAGTRDSLKEEKDQEKWIVHTYIHMLNMCWYMHLRDFSSYSAEQQPSNDDNKSNNIILIIIINNKRCIIDRFFFNWAIFHFSLFPILINNNTKPTHVPSKELYFLETLIYISTYKPPMVLHSLKTRRRSPRRRRKNTPIIKSKTIHLSFLEPRYNIIIIGKQEKNIILMIILEL